MYMYLKPGKRYYTKTAQNQYAYPVGWCTSCITCTPPLWLIKETTLPYIYPHLQLLASKIRQIHCCQTALPDCVCLFVHLSTINLDQPDANSVAW